MINKIERYNPRTNVGYAPPNFVTKAFKTFVKLRDSFEASTNNKLVVSKVLIN